MWFETDSNEGNNGSLPFELEHSEIANNIIKQEAPILKTKQTKQEIQSMQKKLQQYLGELKMIEESMPNSFSINCKASNTHNSVSFVQKFINKIQETNYDIDAQRLLNENTFYMQAIKDKLQDMHRYGPVKEQLKDLKHNFLIKAKEDYNFCNKLFKSFLSFPKYRHQKSLYKELSTKIWQLKALHQIADDAEYFYELQQTKNEFHLTFTDVIIKLQEAYFSYKKIIQATLLNEIDRLKPICVSSGGDKVFHIINAYENIKFSDTKNKLHDALILCAKACRIERNSIFISLDKPSSYKNFIAAIEQTPYKFLFEYHQERKQKNNKSNLRFERF